MADNQFTVAFYFRKLGVGVLNYIPIEAFGKTIRDKDMVYLAAEHGDVYATMREIERQANQQMKIVKTLHAMKINPINPKLPKYFFGMGWSPGTRYEKTFADVRDRQGKASAGHDSWVSVGTLSGNQTYFTMEGAMVLAVEKDRMGFEKVQFEYDTFRMGKYK